MKSADNTFDKHRHLVSTQTAISPILLEVHLLVLIPWVIVLALSKGKKTFV